MHKIVNCSFYFLTEIWNKIGRQQTKEGGQE